MPDVFISYSRKDQKIAQFFANSLIAGGLSVFLDALTLKPGVKWTETLHAELKDSPILLFLASRDAVASPTVNQELGMAMANGASVIPIVWNMRPEELPEWIKRYQAVILTNKKPDEVKAAIQSLVDQVKADKTKRLLIGGLIAATGIGLLFYLGSRK